MQLLKGKAHAATLVCKAHAATLVCKAHAATLVYMSGKMLLSPHLRRTSPRPAQDALVRPPPPGSLPGLLNPLTLWRPKPYKPLTKSPSPFLR